jgi:hypothetical protein
MSEPQQPLEERPEVADAVQDDVAVDAFITGGGPDADTPEFQAPGEEPESPGSQAPGDEPEAPGSQAPGDEPESRDFEPPASQAPGSRGLEASPSQVSGEETGLRTGADQPWDPEDLAVAHGWDPTPENIERARRELERDGPAAIEKTVP